jgi:predicted dehydrogenase
LSLPLFRVLLIGCGNIAGRFDMVRPVDAWPLTHAGAFQSHGGYELVACIDPDEQTRCAFATYWDIARHAPSLEVLGALPGEFDVIGLCSPTALHHTHMEALLLLKPRVIFCEKPLTYCLRESARWEQACKEQGVTLAVNYTRQWDPSVCRLVEEFRLGCWGAIRSAVGYYNKGVLNNGGHLVDLLLRLLGPLEVLAAATPVHDYWDSDPTVSGLLRSKEGQVPVCLAPAHAKDYSLFELELVCEMGVIRMRNGGMNWDTRHVEVSPHFSGYRSLAGADSCDGDYLQAMTLAVTEIHQHLSHGTGIRSDGAHALAIQDICEQLLVAANYAAPLTNRENYDGF